MQFFNYDFKRKAIQTYLTLCEKVKYAKAAQKA